MALKIKNSNGEWVVDQKAIQTSIVDLEGNFESENVEGALRELANKIKQGEGTDELKIKVNNIENKVAVAESTETQDILTDVLLCAMDEMYQLIEPYFESEIEVMATKEQTLEIVSHGLANLYLMMVKRNLKTLDTVPVRYRAYIEEHI